MPKTVRLRLIEYVVALVQSINISKSDQEPYAINFSDVAIGKMTPVKTKRAVAGVVVGQERRNQGETGGFQVQDPTLELWVEWSVTIQTKENSTDVMEHFLGAIQLAFLEDAKGGDVLGGLAFECDEMTNEIQSSSTEDNTQQGVILYRVKYRHDRSDPRIGMTD